MRGESDQTGDEKKRITRSKIDEKERDMQIDILHFLGPGVWTILRLRPKHLLNKICGHEQVHSEFNDKER